MVNIPDIAACKFQLLFYEFYKLVVKQLFLIVMILDSFLECLKLWLNFFLLDDLMLCCFLLLLDFHVVLFQIFSFGLLFVDEIAFFFLVIWIFLKPVDEVLDRSLWFFAVEICESFGDYLTDAILL